MKEIIINGQSLDISDDEPVALTLQVNNIAELKDRQASYSNEIKVPLTSKNRIILGNPDLAGSNSVKPYRLPQTTFIQNGIVVLPGGVHEITETEGDFASMVIFSGLIDFFKIIEGKKISDLDLSAMDHIWKASIAGYLNGLEPSIDRCIYPLMQTGSIEGAGPLALNGSDFPIQYQLPCVYFEKIINQIFIEAGYEKKGLIFSDPLYKKMIMQCNGSLKYPQKFVESRTSLIGMYNVVKHSKPGIGGPSYWGPFILDWNNEDQISTYNNAIVRSTYYTGYKDGDSNCFNVANGRYTANGSFKLQFDIRLPIDINIHASKATGKIRLLKNGNEIANDIKSADAGEAHPNRYVILEIHHSDICQAGDQYSTNFEIHHDTSLTAYDATVPSPQEGAGAFTSDKIFFKVTVLPEIEINMKLPISMLLPDMTQTDFIKAWAQMFCITFNSVPLENMIECKQFQEIPRSEPLNWSDKIDFNQPVKIQYRFEDYGQKNVMKYADAEESERAGLGDGYFNIDDQALELSKNVIELPFQASDETTVLDDVRCAWLPLFATKPGSPPTYERQSLKSRIFLVKRITKDINYKDGVNTDFGAFGGTVPVAYFNEASEPYNLSFSNNLKDRYYTELIQALDKCKIVRAYFYLTETDVQNLDFFRQVYVEYFNLMFYVNVVEQYVEGRSTLVELVKL